MQPRIPASLERQGVSEKMFHKMLAWGWVDIAGNPLEWSYWPT